MSQDRDVSQMVAFTRSVPNAWSEHDKLAKTTPGGMGIHAAMLDRDIGPLLQTQKLLNWWCSHAPRATSSRLRRPNSN